MELMVTPSILVQTGFVSLSLLVGSWWVWAMGRAYAGHGEMRAVEFNHKMAIRAAAFVFGWLVFTAIVSTKDWVHTFESFPPPGLRVMLFLVFITCVIAYSKVGKVLAQNIPLYLLVGFQVFRIPVEFFIHQAYSEKLTIVQLTFLGRNFDIISGILALLLAILVYRGKISDRMIKIWNIVGLLLLTNVVLIGIFSMPHPMQLIETDIPNIWITFFPFIWLPGVLVCSALLGHLLVFRSLKLRKNSH